MRVKWDSDGPLQWTASVIILQFVFVFSVVWLTWGFGSKLSDLLTAHFLPHWTSFWQCCYVAFIEYLLPLGIMHTTMSILFKWVI